MQAENYLNLFIEESKESLQRLNDSLLALEENSGDTEILNDIFRIAHTFKGMSKSMGFNDIGDLTHNMENILEDLRQGKIKAGENIINNLFNCSDKLQELVDKIVEGTYQDKANDIEALVKNIQEASGKITSSAPNNNIPGKSPFDRFEVSIIKNAKESGFIPVEIVVRLVSDCVLKGPRAYMVVKALEGYGELIKTLPETEELENGGFEQEFRLYILNDKHSNDNIKTAVLNISEVDYVEINGIDVDALEREMAKQEVPVKEAKNSKKKANRQGAQRLAANQTIRVNFAKLSLLMDLVGELVINRTRVEELSGSYGLDDLSSVVDIMGNITTEIQETVMQLRMVPIEQVFSRFPRLVRDLSKNLNKDIELKMVGMDTEIDRLVIEEIGDPLIHLVRNSLDHGIEIPEERVKNGKPREGTIELAACNDGDNILIRVSDDGRGIDPEKIKSIALKKELIAPEKVNELSETEALELIFLPGLSSAEVTTDISGRGVGMDAVKAKINDLGGNITLASKIGSGTEITISLPSTMAIIQALLVKLGRETYALPLNNVCEVVEIKKNSVKVIQNKEVMSLREDVLPVIKLKDVLEVPECDNCNSGNITVVVVKTQDKYAGLVVSELLGQQEVVIKPVSKTLCPDTIISGAITLGNGEIAFILNVSGLI